MRMSGWRSTGPRGVVAISEIKSLCQGLKPRPLSREYQSIQRGGDGVFIIVEVHRKKAGVVVQTAMIDGAFTAVLNVINHCLNSSYRDPSDQVYPGK